VVGVVTLDQIREPAAGKLYPRHVLVGCADALVLFAAAFHGKQDAIWMADAGLTATCVDLDGERLEEMRAVYPDGWRFEQADVFSYAVRTPDKFDVVSIDCPTNLFEDCAELLPLWCRIARKAVVLGCALKTPYEIPSGWRQTDLLFRSNFQGGTYWRVFEPVES
jgi:hypothetical protein